MKYLSSAFSLQMVPQGATLEIKTSSLEDFRELVSTEPEGKPIGFVQDEEAKQGRRTVWASYRRVLNAQSIIGHEGTAKALSTLLECEVPTNRQAIELQPGDELWVAQPTGKRIAYGEEIDFPELSFFIVKFHTCKHPGWEDVLARVDARVVLDSLMERGVRITPQPQGIKIGMPAQEMDWYF